MVMPGDNIKIVVEHDCADWRWNKGFALPSPRVVRPWAPGWSPR